MMPTTVEAQLYNMNVYYWDTVLHDGALTFTDGFFATTRTSATAMLSKLGLDTSKLSEQHMALMYTSFTRYYTVGWQSALRS